MRKKLMQVLSAKVPGEHRQALILLGYRSLVALAMIKTHGLKKVADISEEIANIPDPLGLGGEFTAIMAIFTNLVLTVFVILGFLTRLSALGILSVTLSGLFLVHWGDPWPVKDVPLMYSLAFLLILTMGPGKYSLDHFISKKLTK